MDLEDLKQSKSGGRERERERTQNLECFIVEGHLTHYKWYDYKHAHTTYTKQLREREGERERERERERESPTPFIKSLVVALV